MTNDSFWVVSVPTTEWTCEHKHATAADAFRCLDEYKRQRDAIGHRFPLKIKPVAREHTAARAAGA